MRVTILARESVADSLFLRAGVEPRKRYVGALLSADPRAIELRDDDSSRTIPREVVAHFEESLGRKSSAGPGARIGALAGAVSGIALGIVLNEIEDVEDEYKIPVVVVFGFGGALAGCGVGALAGAFIKRETWAPAENTPVRGER